MATRWWRREIRFGWFRVSVRFEIRRPYRRYRY